MKVEIAPNTEILKTSIALDVKNENFTDLADTVAGSTRLGQEHRNIDSIEGIVGRLVDSVNGGRADDDQIWFILNSVDNSGVGVISHKFTFLSRNKAKKVKPAYLTVTWFSAFANKRGFPKAVCCL